MPGKEFLRMEHIRKVYSNGVVANSDITFAVDHGEIHALSGENGAGKTTLMKMLFGEEQPTRGDIYINGEKTVIASSAAAIRLGIGMVHQHFMLARPLTVTENVMLGRKSRRGILLDTKETAAELSELSDRYKMGIDPNAKIWQLSVGEQQRVEILTAIYMGAEILILDEPTAVLTPQETEVFFETLRQMRDDGKSIILITHNMGLVAEMADEVCVMYMGRVVEFGTLEDVFDRTSHPYTRALLRSVPVLGLADGQKLETIPGATPNPADLKEGCEFADRCPECTEKCRKGVIPCYEVNPGHHVRCTKYSSFPEVE